MSDQNLKDNEAKLEKVKKTLGEPTIDDFSSNVLSIRRNLLIFASIALFYKLNHLQISPEVAYLGVKISGLTDRIIDKSLLFLILYHFCHFFWSCIDHIFYLKTRSTGNFTLKHVTTGIMSAEEGDYPSNPRQSSLYNWWIKQKHKITDYETIKNEIECFSKKLDQFIENAPETDKNDRANSIADLKNQISPICRKIAELINILGNERIEESLRRFDRGFFIYRKTQLLRFFIIEAGAPIILGFWSLYLLIISWLR